MVAEVAALTGAAPYDVPGPLLRAFAAMGSVAGRLLPLPAQVSAEAMRSAQASYLATPAKAIDELGWSFRPLSVGCLRAWCAVTTSAWRTEVTLQAVLWDMDGTLVSTESLWMIAETTTMESFGGHWDAQDQSRLGGRTG